MPLSISAAATSTTISSSDNPPAISAASIAKRLASPDPAIRNRTVRNLSTLLPSLAPLSESNLLKIWKGLFYCYWHSDKALYQSNLATSIASLISSNQSELATSFLDTALITLRREWGSIDFLRMDKFYLLVRRILKHTFLLLKMNNWDLNLVSIVMSIVEGRGFGEVGGVRGFSYHVVEVFFEEFNGFLPVKKEVLEVVINPFLNILKESNDSILVNKVKVNVFDKFLVNGEKYLGLKKSGGEIERGSEVDLFGIIGLIMGFSEKLLEVAKKEETVQANKKVLHDLRDWFFKLEKGLKKGGFEIEILIPQKIEIVENVGGLDEKLPKKRKKKNRNKGEKKEKQNSEGKNKKKKMKTQEENINNNNTLSEENNENKTEDQPLIPNESERETGEKEKEDSEKKKKMKTLEENKNNIPISDDDNTTNVNPPQDETLINFDQTLISNLQKQFEKAAAEAGMSTNIESNTSPSKKATKKRKQKPFKNSSESLLLEASSENKNGEEINTTTTSAKKVRFSIKDNVVWKPSAPLPPVSLRLPPTVTPRGSALKKGVPAGPIREGGIESVLKRRRVKMAKSGIKKGVIKSPSLVKIRKIKQNMSA